MKKDNFKKRIKVKIKWYVILFDLRETEWK